MGRNKSNFSKIKKFLRQFADDIQKLATNHHKEFLGGKIYRSEFIDKYQKSHIKIVKALADNLEVDIKKGTQNFKTFGEALAKASVKDGLTLEETVDGLIFLKQAVWEMLYKKAMLNDLAIKDFYEINQTIGTYCDVLSSKIAFVYHEYYKKEVLKVGEQAVINEKRYRTIIEQSPLSTQILSPQGKTLIVNKAWEELWGAKLEQLKNYNMLEDKQLIKSGTMSYIKRGFRGEPTLIPAIRYEPNKTIPNVSEVDYRWVKAFIYPVRDESGHIREVVLVHDDITQQKKTEEALKESESRFKAIVNQATAGVAQSDLTGKFILVNDRYCDIVGYTREELLNKKMQDITHPDDLPNNIKLFKHMVKTGENFKIEMRYIHKDGSVVWISNNVSLVHETIGKPNTVLAVTIDITERKKVEESVQKSDERYRLIAKATNDAIWDWDLKTNQVQWNEAVSTLFGYKTKNVGNDANWWYENIHQDDRKRIVDSIHKVIDAGGESWGDEYRYQNADGTYKYVFDRGYIIHDEKGKSVRMIGSMLDLTERKRAEERQKFLEHATKILGASIEYETTLKNLGKLIIPELADYCRIVIVDDKKEIKEIAVNHIDSKKLPLVRELYNAYKDEKTNNSGVGRLLETGKSECIEKITPEIIKNANPKIVHLVKELNLRSYMGTPMKIDSRIVGAITFSSSRDDRLYGKEDVALAEELARRAALAIENARLYAETQKAVVIRDEFISAASHELKTPVTSLKMYTQVVKSQLEKKGDDPLIRPLNKMDDQIKKLTRLIGDLLNVSKMQTGKLEFHEEAFDINDAIKEVVEAVQQTTEKHTIVIDGSIKKYVWGDRDRVEQVITNLLTNAVKYSPLADRVLVQLISEKDFAVISVQDFGIGIDREHQKRIFDRFYRVTDPNEKTFPGLGIGLYISYNIIKRLGGDMTVLSAKGKGSKFSFTLPYKNTG